MLKSEGIERLWLTEDHSDLFLIPVDVCLCPGPLRLVNLSGEEQAVAPASVASYEVTRAEAKQHFRAQLGPFVTALQALAAAGDMSPAPGDPDRAALHAYLVGLGNAVQAATADEPAAERSRRELRRLRNRLRREGVEIDPQLDALPSQLQRLLRTPQPEEWATISQVLSEMTAALAPTDDDPDLDRVVALLDERLGSLLGFAEEQAAADARQQRALHKRARTDIAAALRRHGITPADEGEEDDAHQ